MRCRTIGGALAWALLAAPAIDAQVTPPRDTSALACPNARPATEVRGAGDTTRRTTAARDTARGGQGTGAPDIILRASVSAREVRFATQPQVSIRLCGGALDSVRVVERRNLPSPVVAGTTYRDVYVAIEILGHLTGSCIADRLTTGGQRNAATSPCASIGFRDTTGARRAAPARRPE